MTIAAAGNFENFNILVTDSIVKTAYSYNMIKYKIDLIQDTNLYLVLLGNEMILDGISRVNNWARIKKREVNFYSKEYIDIILQSERMCRNAYNLNIPKLPDLPPNVESETARLIFCEKNKIYYWTLAFNSNRSIFERTCEVPVDLVTNKVYTFYGGLEPEIFGYTATEESIEKDMINRIKNIHERYRTTENFLKYDLNDLFCSLLISKKDGTIKESLPFKYLSEYIYGSYTGPQIIHYRNSDIWDPYEQ